MREIYLLFPPLKIRTRFAASTRTPRRSSACTCRRLETMRMLSRPPPRAAAAFRPSIPWEGRKWLRWEKLLFSATQSPAKGAALLAVLLPLSLVAVPVLPLASLALLRAPPTPRGLYEVGVAEVQPTLQLQGPGNLTGPEQIRLRVFYPAERPAAAPRRWLLAGSGGVRSWLPPGGAARRYAEAHVGCLPLPKRLVPFLRRFLGWVLHFARLPRRVAWGAPAVAPPAARDGASGAWPLTLFSHGLYGCAISYSACCAELASHGSVVVALEHKDGTAIYSETDDGARLVYGEGERGEHRGPGESDESQGSDARTMHRVAEVRALLRQIGEVSELLGAQGGLPDDGLRMSTDGVTLVGHSFGASTVLSAASAIAKAGEEDALKRKAAEDAALRLEEEDALVNEGELCDASQMGCESSLATFATAFPPAAAEAAAETALQAAAEAAAEVAEEAAVQAAVQAAAKETPELSLVEGASAAAAALAEAQAEVEAEAGRNVEPSLVEGALTPAATVGAVVVLDPWISGYNCSTDAAAAVPTLALMTQSMMYESNADAVGETLGRVAARGETALFAELAESRHQEVSDFPSMIYFLMRASCMAGALPPRRAFCGTLELVVGFLSCVGAAGDGVNAGAGELAAGRMLLRGNVDANANAAEVNEGVTEGEERAPSEIAPVGDAAFLAALLARGDCAPTGSADGADEEGCCDVLEGCGKFYLHGGACAPGLEPRVRTLVRAAEMEEIVRAEAALGLEPNQAELV